jgi:hypothetical protein
VGQVNSVLSHHSVQTWTPGGPARTVQAPRLLTATIREASVRRWRTGPRFDDQLSDRTGANLLAWHNWQQTRYLARACSGLVLKPYSQDHMLATDSGSGSAQYCCTILASDSASLGVMVPAATAHKIDPMAAWASAGPCTGGKGNEIGPSLRGGTKRSRHSLSARMSPARASSTALRVNASAAPLQDRLGRKRGAVPGAFGSACRVARSTWLKGPTALLRNCYFSVHRSRPFAHNQFADMGRRMGGP